VKSRQRSRIRRKAPIDDPVERARASGLNCESDGGGWASTD
jgi:hypothetical protein